MELWSWSFLLLCFHCCCVLGIHTCKQKMTFFVHQNVFICFIITLFHQNLKTFYSPKTFIKINLSKQYQLRSSTDPFQMTIDNPTGWSKPKSSVKVLVLLGDNHLNIAMVVQLENKVLNLDLIPVTLNLANEVKNVWPPAGQSTSGWTWAWHSNRIENTVVFLLVGWSVQEANVSLLVFMGIDWNILPV